MLFHPGRKGGVKATGQHLKKGRPSSAHAGLGKAGPVPYPGPSRAGTMSD